MIRLHLALLGPLNVLLDGQPVTTFGYDKVRALLTYLVVEVHRSHDRSALATLLWPSELDSIARKNLRTALTTLRQAINDSVTAPSFLLITRTIIQFNPASDYELDVDVFDELLAQVKVTPTMTTTCVRPVLPCWRVQLSCIAMSSHRGSRSPIAMSGRNGCC